MRAVSTITGKSGQSRNTMPTAFPITVSQSIQSKSDNAVSDRTNSVVVRQGVAYTEQHPPHSSEASSTGGSSVGIPSLECTSCSDAVSSR